MPLLQGQPFRLIKAPETVPSGAELYVIQHTGEKFLVKSDYEDRLALYSQSIWTCQCSGKSGLTHQEAWTSESKVRVMLSSSFPAPLWSPILHCIHHSTQPLDQLVETTSALCLSKFHPGEELTYLNPTTQVRVVSSRAAPGQPEISESKPEKPDSSSDKPKAGDSNSSSPIPPPLTNGCTNNNRDVAPSLNGTSNGSAAMEEGSPSSSTKPKEDSPGRKKGMLSLLYDVVVIGEDRKIKDVPSKDLQRTYKIPPKEHFRLFIRANALRQRASAFTPWIVSEDLVKQYNIPSKLASIFTQPSFNFTAKKRKLDQPVEKAKKQKNDDNKKIKTEKEKEKIKKEPKDTNAPKKKPATKSGVKRSLKVELNKVESLPVKSETPVKMETSDSDDDISLAALASKSPKLEADNTELKKTPEKVGLAKPVKRETEKDSLPNKKMKQATLFDLKPSKTVTGSGTSSSPKKSPQKRVITSETVMRMPVMRRLLHQRKLYKGVRGMGRKIVYIMDQALNKLSLKHIAAISDQELQDELMKRREKVMEKRILATMSAEDREAYLKQKSLEEKKKKQETKFVQTLKIREENRKLEDKILSDLKPLPAPKLVPTPEEIPNSLFGEITMIIEFIECYREIVLTDKKNSISSQHLIQALSAGKEGFKFISEIMVLLLHIIIDDERIGDNKELGVKLSELAVHYQTAMELARLCLSKGGSSDTASQHSDDHEYEEECELSEGLLKKLDTHELYELQAEEIIEVLRALCHRAMASYTCLEYFEDIDEKAAALHKQYLQIKKENNKQELLKKKEKREELLKKKMEKNVPSPKKTPGRPKKQSNTLENFIKKDEPAKEAAEEESPDIISVVKRKRMTAEELQKEKEEQSKELREKQRKEEEEMRKQQIILAWEKINLQKEALARLQPLGVDRNHDRYWLFNCTTPGLYVEKGWVDANTTYCVKGTSPRKEAVNGQLEMEKSPGVSPSLSSPTSEKDPGSVLHTPITSPEKDAPEPSNINGTGFGISESSPAANSISEKSNSVKHTPGRRGRPPKPKVDTPPRPRGRPPKEKLPGEEKIVRPRGRPPKPKSLEGTPVKNGEESPGKGRPRGRPKAFRLINDDETFPPVGQNMWFYYNTLEEIDSLLESLAVKGLRESKLKTAIMQARKQMETNFVKEWQPLEDLVDGSVQLLETLREDIIQIEKELNEGWLGSVPEPEAWEKKANEATTVQELGECLIEAQRHIQIKFLKGIMKPVRKPIPTENPEAQQEYEEVEGTAVQHWREAITNCSTLSRLHLLVGMFDSCIKWEKSMATKKCKVCRAQDTSVPLAICDKCEGSYHWRCLRPQLTEEPPEPWLCPGCQPNKKERRNLTRNQVEEEREEPLSTEFKQEKICRVCERGIGLIFCSKCPAAYHSECHDPPLQTRARKDWKCVDCQKPRSRSSRAAVSAKQDPSKTKGLSKKESRSNTKSVVSKESTSRRSSTRGKYTEVEEDEDEEEEEEEEELAGEESSENDDSHDEDFSTRRKSTRVRKTVNPPRRTTSRSVKKRSYKIESEEEEDGDEELAEEEEEEQEGSEDEQVEDEEQGSDDDQEEEDEEGNEDDDKDDEDEEGKEVDEDEDDDKDDEDEEGKEVDEDDEDEDSEVERDEEEEDDEEEEEDEEEEDENQDEKEEDDSEED
ncbi:tyrosine-protein kinase BAZ1B-like isoform X2 [Palaemon carinicauda]|uniref:tyrosine-protein kinase BAZ1B-like isoform X2 n=1 Tax=Palaemon carinicauda TaxID=392227 RepID=UPI0035B59619